MRILLPKNEQRKFIEKILTKISVAEAAEICNLCNRTIRDWRREKFLMQKDAMLKLCEETKTPIPKNLKEKNDYWYVYKGAELGGHIGGLACIKKYGCVGGPRRKEKWYKWWNKKGKFLAGNLFRPKPVKLPRKSKELAEFIGIMLGDGHVPLHGVQIQITLNNRDDSDYIAFVTRSINNLFSRKPSICRRNRQNASMVNISSARIVDRLLKLGLKRGNKVKLQVDIPQWIKNNENFLISCTRGLIDTDGCVFEERHKIKTKSYKYKRLNFSNRSLNLLNSVFLVFDKLGLKPKMRQHSVQVENAENIKKYFDVVGTHNPKHLKRYKK